jgi:hypothetical protein
VAGDEPHAGSTCNRRVWGFGANGNTSALHAEVKGSIPLTSTMVKELSPGLYRDEAGVTTRGEVVGAGK